VVFGFLAMQHFCEMPQRFGTIRQIPRCPRSNVGEVLLMDRRDAYLLMAAELTELAENSRYDALKKVFQSLAFAYLRVAELAKHNDDLDIVYETTPLENRRG
jgi:hypothetical protein